MAYYKVTKKQSGGSPSRIPVIVYSASQNITLSVADFSYTFTESGTFQYYFYIRNVVSSSTLVATLNGVAITPAIVGGGYFAIGEITVNANDVLNIKNTFTANNSGAQIFILKNADISRFAVIGTMSNINATFDISTEDSPYLQVYHMGYYSGRNNYQYQIGITDDIHIYQDTEGRTEAKIQSIPTPNIEQYYYGGTYAIRV